MSETNVFSKMAGTKAIVRFVKEIERHPCLYDRKSLDYLNRELKRKTWIEIAKKVKSTPKECKDKWVRIRVAYIRTLRPSYNQRRLIKTPYYLADHLKFIKPVKGNNSIVNETSQSTSEDGIQANESPEIHTNIVYDEASSIDIDDYKNSEHQMFLDVDKNYSDDEISNDSHTEIGTKETILNDVNKTKVIESIVIPSSKEPSRTNDNNKDRTVKKRHSCHNIECKPRKMFLLSLMPDIESLTEKKMRSFRRRVIELIDNLIGE